ncbi:1-acyl-sn-glycerol-3-phosphate acyltransferase [Polaribacter sp.]|uniref:1-acyl-sn-glycerol-3-phosphate acyltransferase n=1 Tax=Polaribacter sp. TaxID=1920175 RepID=UPI003F6C69D8
MFFYAKKIKVTGKNNIPKKGAVLFMANHPNGLIDPLFVTTNNPRTNHFLVRAAVFKKPIIKKFLGTLNLMPIYRIRDGVKELGKNKAIFNDCFEIFRRKETLLIFPEGSHDCRRTIRPLSKGFTRIVFGALEKYPNLKITIIPVGITYQNSTAYPSKVAINYGKPILANSFLEKDELITAIVKIKNAVSAQLKELTVHIVNDENYTQKLAELNSAQVDFTDVLAVNKILENEEFPPAKNPIKNNFRFLYYILILNNLIPFVIWKQVAKKVDEIEFVDTFRFAVNAITVPIFLGLQTWLISYFYGAKISFCYTIISLLLILTYTKLAPTNTKSNS